MTHTNADPRLEMHWTPVEGPDGRTRMEAAWAQVDPPALGPHVTATAHAA